MANGRVPGQAIMDGVAVLAGGAFLLTPGVLTDLVGFGLVGLFYFLLFIVVFVVKKHPKLLDWVEKKVSQISSSKYEN